MEYEIVGLIASVLMGFTLGLIGGGGAILTVPILVYLFKINPILATAYSLFIVGTTALFGGFNYYKKGEVDLKTGLIFAIPSLISVYIVRSFIVPNIPFEIFKINNFILTKPILIMTVFSVVMLLASFSMISSKKNLANKENQNKKNYIRIPLQGLLIGSIAGFVGAGGGFLIIPTLVILVELPMKKAIGTSLFIIAIQSLLGFIGDVQHQNFINWFLLLKIVSVALIGLFFGIKLSSKFSEKSLKKGFGIFVLTMGILIFMDQLRKM